MSDGRWGDEGAAGEVGRLLPGDADERLALYLSQQRSAVNQLDLLTEALMDCASMVASIEGDLELSMELSRRLDVARAAHENLGLAH